MKKFIIFLILMAVSCSTSQVSISPTKAGIPELKFYYFKDGEYREVYGHGGDVFNEGESKKFLIKLHRKKGKCQLRVIDGDFDETYSCEGITKLELDLGAYRPSSNSVIGFSLSTKKMGSQLGFFYPVYTHFNSLPVDYVCPYQKTLKNIDICTRPANFEFTMRMRVLANEPGEYLYTYQCDKFGSDLITGRISGAGSKEFKIKVPEKDYCVFGFALKQGDKGYYQVLHTRFYSPEYLPLPVPTVKKRGKYFYIYPIEDLKYSRVNNRDHSRAWHLIRYRRVKSSSIEVEYWDKLGRYSWNKQSSKKGTNYINGFSLYNSLYNWAFKKINCSPDDVDCYKLNILQLLKDPIVTKTLETWDESYLR